MDTANFYTVNGNIFVKELKEENEFGGMIIPDDLNEDFIKGKVVFPINNYLDENSAKFEVGDIILFPKISSTKVQLYGETYLKVSSCDVIMKIK